MSFVYFFVGEHAKEVMDYQAEHGCNILRSYVNDQLGISRWIERRKSGQWKGYCKRAIVSSFIGQLFDDYVFVFLAFAPFGISAIENPWKAIITVPICSCLVEVAVEALITPVSHKVCVKHTKYLKEGN